ncbi:unnamed protein product [Discosporangium mesarthrocarpum]
MAFRRLLVSISERPSLHVPDRRTVRRIIENDSKERKKDLKAQLGKAVCRGVPDDGWLDILGQRQYIAVTTHFIDEDEMQLEGACLAVSPIPGTHNAKRGI